MIMAVLDCATVRRRDGSARRPGCGDESLGCARHPEAHLGDLQIYGQTSGENRMRMRTRRLYLVLYWNVLYGACVMMCYVVPMLSYFILFYEHFGACPML
jgi:hypothetical protein